MAKDCIDNQVKVLVVISAGFSEVGGEGVQMEEELVKLASENNLRLVGPNSMGVFSGVSFENKPMDATFSPIQTKAGDIAFLSQSGAIGAVLMNYGNQYQIGLSRFVSLGNKADIDENILIDYLHKDNNTKVIALYLESFVDGRQFMKVCQKVNKTKPILAVKSGRTSAGIRAAASHTGALASKDAIVDSVFEHSGIIRCEDIKEMLICAYGLSKTNIPNGNRFSVISNAGGPGTLQTDELQFKGIEIPELSKETQYQLKSFLPIEASTDNPIDILPSASPEIYYKTVQTVLDSNEVDGAIVLLLPPVLFPIDEMLEGIERVKTEKTLIVVAMGCEGMIEDYQKYSMPILHLPKNAAFLVSSALKWRRSMNKKFMEYTHPLPSGIINEKDSWLNYPTTEKLLNAYGIEMANGQVVESFEKAKNTFSKIPKPVVVKLISEKAVHKSDVGGVIAGIEDLTQLHETFHRLDEISKDISDPNRRFLIQEQLDAEFEIVIGGLRDPQFGPMIMVGTGGKLVELIKDVKFHLAPLSFDEAMELISQTRLEQLLKGYRDIKTMDRKQLAGMLVRVGNLLWNEQRIREIDLNPVLPKGDTFVVADARIRV